MVRKITMSLIALMLVFALVSPVFADNGVTETEAAVTSSVCSNGKTHPVIDKLAFTFGLEYATVLGWFCDDYDLSTIKQALRAAASGVYTGEDLDADDNLKKEVFLEKVEEYLKVFADEDDLDVDGDDMDDDLDDDMDDKSNSIYCRDLEGGKEHPTGLRYAGTYAKVLEKVEDKEGTSSGYELIMRWFCDGFGFGQIKHALNTTIQYDNEPDPRSYLDQRARGEGWGVIWKEKGKPAKVHPVFGENWPNGKKNSTQEEGEPVVTGPQGKGKPNKPVK